MVHKIQAASQQGSEPFPKGNFTKYFFVTKLQPCISVLNSITVLYDDVKKTEYELDCAKER